MKHSDTSEQGLETLIVGALAADGYEVGANDDYSREFAVDEARLLRFLRATQPEAAAQLGLDDETARRAFLQRLKSEIGRRGVIEVLRDGLSHRSVSGLRLFYPTPSAGNDTAAELFAQNIFSVTRQLRYSEDETRRALDLCIFINGLPIFTFELKNQWTRQNVHHAVAQYQKDRKPSETLFAFKRCIAHFAVDDAQVMFCTQLVGKDSVFLPFNRGHRQGAGNPPNPDGLMTAYLWRDILSRKVLTLLLEDFVALEEKGEGKAKTQRQIFPRFHQLDVVRKLLADVRQNGVGRRYLIQHSAGSGKSNSIAWLAHQLSRLPDKNGGALFASVLILTDRRILDRQTRDTVRRFEQVKGRVKWAESARDLRQLIEDGNTPIIVSTIEKFPYISEEIGSLPENSRFAIILDEAHSGQGGKNAQSVSAALGGNTGHKTGGNAGNNAGGTGDEEDIEDKINHMMQERKLLKNASYFAFTATPKNKTLEMFGTPEGSGKEKTFHPFHLYSMKQAIEEGFILDVLQNYTEVKSFYHVIQTVKNNPQFDEVRAQKKLHRFVESQPKTIEEKARVMVEHFHDNVQDKIGGQARAMVVTASIARCIDYFYAIQKALKARKSPYQAMIAFSGEHTHGGKTLSSSAMNGFPDAQVPEKLKSGIYRFLVVADMYQTGFDEPLLHTMYVDKNVSGIKTVQTLSRLNRTHPKKFDTCVLDFANNADSIRKDFEPYYQTTLLAGETDPNKLYDLMEEMKQAAVFNELDVREVVEQFLNNAPREALDAVLDGCADRYQARDTEAQIRFKSAAKSFVRVYNFLAMILPFNQADWERLAVFLTLLIPKLPAPEDDDLSQGILQMVHLDNYRNEVRERSSIRLNDADGELAPVPTGSGVGLREPVMSGLQEILAQFNEIFGSGWNADEQERILQLIELVSRDELYQNAMRGGSSEDSVRAECTRALEELINDTDDFDKLYDRFYNDAAFRKSFLESVLKLTRNDEGQPWHQENPFAYYSGYSGYNGSVYHYNAL